MVSVRLDLSALSTARQASNRAVAAWQWELWHRCWHHQNESFLAWLRAERYEVGQWHRPACQSTALVWLSRRWKLLHDWWPIHVWSTDDGRSCVHLPSKESYGLLSIGHIVDSLFSPKRNTKVDSQWWSTLHWTISRSSLRLRTNGETWLLFPLMYSMHINSTRLNWCYLFFLSSGVCRVAIQTQVRQKQSVNNKSERYRLFFFLAGPRISFEPKKKKKNETKKKNSQMKAQNVI